MGDSERGRSALGAALRPRARAIGIDELAWVALLPCALVAAAAIALLGPPLGEALYLPGSDQLWPPGWWEAQGQPEPVVQARYLLAVLAPFGLAGVVLAGLRRAPGLAPWAVRVLTFAGYAALLALVAVALSQQHALIKPGKPAPAIFGPGMVVAAAAIVLAATLLLRRRSVAARAAALVRETRARRCAGLAIAAAFAAIWLLKGIMTDRLTGDVTGLNLPYTLNDALAVLGGRTPLVDYHVIYAKLLPYPTAIVLGTFGTTVLVYTLFMAVLNGLALLAVFAVLRLVTRSSLLALGLFVPFVAASDVDYIHTSAGAVSPLTLSAMWPMRYGGAYLLAWLTARQLDGRRPHRAWVVFLVAGLVAINNLEFGMAATAATVAALLCARPPRSRAAALRLAADAVAGTLGAIAVVCLVTLARAGALPDPGFLLEWPRIFSSLGWFSLPLPALGLHLAVYATFAAAIAVAAVRLARSGDGALLTGMLAWSGVFGLLAGGYFVGRPDAQRLEAILSAWSFALALLAIVCVRALAARDWRRPALPELLVLFGFGLSLCLLSHLSPPQRQIARLTKPLPDPSYLATAERFVGPRTHPGEKVAILLPMSFRISHDLGLDNVSPYGFMNAIVTRSQLQTLIDAVRREHVRAIFTPAPRSFLVQEGDVAPEQLEALIAIGYQPEPAEAGMIVLRRKT